jgi:manganese/zinc/iron transport system permease protein
MTGTAASLTAWFGANALVVASGAAMLGIAGGLVGTFALLQGRALVSDALAHATFPGLVAGFLAGSAMGAGRAPLWLVAGAALSAAAAFGLLGLIRARTRLGEDAGIGLVVGVSYGLGALLMGVAQASVASGQAGLESYLIGGAAGMTRAEAASFGGLALAAIVVVLAARKELALAAFDPVFAATTGLPVRLIGLLFAGLLIATAVAGLRAVGLVLVVAVIVLPAAAASLMSHRLGARLGLAACIGGAGALAGVALSAAAPRLPTGPVIVLGYAGLMAGALLIAGLGRITRRATRDAGHV